MNLDSEENNFLESEDTSFDIKSIIPKIIRIWPYILVSIFVFLAGAYIMTRMSVPQYKVYGLFFIKESDKGFSLFEGAEIDGTAKLGIVNETTILQSRPIAEATLNQLDFTVEYYSKGTFIDKELYQNTPILIEVDWREPQVLQGLLSIRWSDNDNFVLSLEDEAYSKYLPNGTNIELQNIPEPTEYAFGELISTNNFTIKVTKTSPESTGEVYVKFRDIPSLIGEYARRIDIQNIQKEGSILELSLEVPNVKKGEDYVNALMQTYLALELEEKNVSATNTVNFIDSQVAGVSDSLRQFENELQNFRSSNKIYNLESESSSVFEQLTLLEGQLQDQKFKRTYYQNLAGYLVREQYNDLVVPSGIGIEDPILNSLISNLMELQVEKSRQLATLTDQAPQVQATNNKIRDLNYSIREILKNVDENAELLIKDLEDRITDIEGSFRDLPETQQNLIRIQRQFALNENIYNFLMEKRAEAAITKASNTAENRIIEPASGGFLVSPIPFRNYTIGIFIGFMLPILFILFRELIRTKIEDVTFLERKLKVPLLSTILKNKGSNNLVVLEQGKSGIAEGFRSLRANIRFINPNDKQLTVMLTSTISGEGKTFCAMNLASVYSLTGKRTLLVGCDMRKPRIFQDFGIKNEKGLSTYLSGQIADWQSTVNNTPYANLNILLSGPIPPNPAELLFTKRFEVMIEEMKKEYDVVILDTPPVGLVSETLDLLPHVDLTLFVFRQNYSQRNFVDALNGLKVNKGLKNIYAVFNGVDAEKVAYGYGYTYGYGYGYYEDDNKKSKRKVFN